MRDLNLCLLTSWVQRYYEGDSKIWKSIIDYKYQDVPTFSVVELEMLPPFGKE
jgi:hypothetical protein